MWWPFSTKYPEYRAAAVHNHSYDYVVVGGKSEIIFIRLFPTYKSSLNLLGPGGTAGCVLASRLSEDKNATVILIERGIANDTWMSRIPLVSSNILSSDMGATSWYSEPIKPCDDRRDLLFLGQVLGGSSRINGMVHTRGNAANYDAWGSMGHRDWTFRKLLPYFMKAETTLSRPRANHRGGSGR